MHESEPLLAARRMRAMKEPVVGVGAWQGNLSFPSQGDITQNFNSNEMTGKFKNAPLRARRR
jgi:hypothetical protein